MANNFTAAKVVGSLPGTLAANTLYLVRSGLGFALYCSDATGTIAHPINAPTAMVSALNSLSGDLSLSLSQELAASALDPVKKAGTATLTNGRRTVTFTATQSIATGDFGFTTGKHCFAFKFVSGSTSGNAAVGVVDTSITNYAHQIGYDLPQEVGMFQNSGNIYSDEVLATSGSSFATAGDEVAVAVDCDSRLAWFRVNNGNWNNNPASSPETGVGGVSITGTGNIMPAVCSDEASVWDFKSSSLAYPAPTGYGSWSAPAGSLTVTPSDVRIENPTTGQVLMFNGTEWYNGDLPSGGGGGTSKPVGEITMFAGATAPDKHKLCDGAAISRSTYSALFDVIGTTYGTGDGSTTFNVPNMGGKLPMGVNGSHALGAAAGSNSVTLSRANMPAYPIDTRMVGSNVVTGGSENFLAATAGSGPTSAAIFTTAEPTGANIGGYLVGGSSQTAVDTTPAHLAINFLIYTGA